MPLLLTSYIFVSDILNRLDENYETSKRKTMPRGDIMFKTAKCFMYSNIINILSIDDKYNISKRLLNSLDELESKTINYIKSEKYDRSIILMSIALISIKQLYESITKTFTTYSQEDLRDIDYLFAKKNNINPYTITKEFDKSFIADFKELDFISFIVNQEIKFPLADKIFENNLKKFHKILSYNKLERFINKKYNDYYYQLFDGKNVNIMKFQSFYDEILGNTYNVIVKYLNYIYLK